MLSLFILLSLFIVILFPFKTQNNVNLDPKTIEKKIIPLGDLITVQYNYRNILSYEHTKEYKGIELPFTTKGFLIEYTGYIKAGVDLKNIEVKIKEKDISITLKEAAFTDNVINEEDVLVYDERSGLFNKLNLEEVFKILEKEKKNTQEELKKTQFLKKANEKTKKLLEALLKEMGFENITIYFKQNQKTERFITKDESLCFNRQNHHF